MKKVRITLKSGSIGKKFTLFPDAETLYVWSCSVEDGAASQPEGIEELVLEPGGFIEAELRGYEYSYEGNGKFRRLNYVRLAKAQNPKNSSGLLVTTHKGWVLSGMFQLRNYVDEDVNVVEIDDDDSRLNMNDLFKDDDEEEREGT